MADAKMSIAESNSEAHTLIEPVIQPVTVLIAMRKAAAMMESRAAERLAASSDAASARAFVASARDFCIEISLARILPNQPRGASGRSLTSSCERRSEEHTSELQSLAYLV